MTRDPARYRPCVGVMLLNPDDLVWVGERHGLRGSWQMPQGGIDAGETPWQAAERELAEETGISSTERLAESAIWHYYEVPTDLTPQSWRGRFVGQRQRWFACRFHGIDADVDIVSEGEFVAWRWVPMHELPVLIVPFKRPIYEALVAEFAHLVTEPTF